MVASGTGGRSVPFSPLRPRISSSAAAAATTPNERATTVRRKSRRGEERGKTVTIRQCCAVRWVRNGAHSFSARSASFSALLLFPSRRHSLKGLAQRTSSVLSPPLVAPVPCCSLLLLPLLLLLAACCRRRRRHAFLSFLRQHSLGVQQRTRGLPILLPDVPVRTCDQEAHCAEDVPQEKGSGRRAWWGRCMEECGSDGRSAAESERGKGKRNGKGRNERLD